MWWKRPMPTRRHASSRVWVPSTLVRKNRPGIDDRQAVVGLGGEVDDHVHRVLAQGLLGHLLVADVAVDPDVAALDVGQAGLVAGVGQGVVGDDPVAWDGCSTQWRTKFEPMKPAPPVTTMFTMARVPARQAARPSAGTGWSGKVDLAVVADHQPGGPGPAPGAGHLDLFAEQAVLQPSGVDRPGCRPGSPSARSRSARRRSRGRPR